MLALSCSNLTPLDLLPSDLKLIGTKSWKDQLTTFFQSWEEGHCLIFLGMSLGSSLFSTRAGRAKAIHNQLLTGNISYSTLLMLLGGHVGTLFTKANQQTKKNVCKLNSAHKIQILEARSARIRCENLPLRGWKFAASIGFALQYLNFAYWAVAWCTVMMQLFTCWMWTDANRVNQSRLIHVNAVTVEALECNIFKKTNSFCDVINERSPSTCSPREISTSFLGNLHFCKPCVLHSLHALPVAALAMPSNSST